MTDRTANIQHLASLIKDVEIAMLTTTQADGRLVSRPLGTQQVEFDGDCGSPLGRQREGG